MTRHPSNGRFIQSIYRSTSNAGSRKCGLGKLFQTLAFPHSYKHVLFYLIYIYFSVLEGEILNRFGRKNSDSWWKTKSSKHLINTRKITVRQSTPWKNLDSDNDWKPVACSPSGKHTGMSRERFASDDSMDGRINYVSAYQYYWRANSYQKNQRPQELDTWQIIDFGACIPTNPQQKKIRCPAPSWEKPKSES